MAPILPAVRPGICATAPMEMNEAGRRSALALGEPVGLTERSSPAAFLDTLRGRSAMKPVATFSMAVVLASVLAAPGFAAVGSEEARDANARNQAETSSQTNTPWSSTMSSSNTPSHDGNSQLGKNQGSGAAPRNRVGSASQPTAPSTSGMSSVDTPRWNRAPGQSAGSTKPGATNPGCGGTC
jgi:hypothetical protein